MAGRLQGKVAFITGAARGQGRAHAVRMAEEGADIIAVDICAQIDSNKYPLASAEDLAETERMVKETGQRILARVADVRERSELRETVEAGVADLGRLDIIVANAGIMPMALGNPQAQDFVDATDVDLIGVMNTVGAGLPYLNDHGSVIVTGSTAALMPRATDSPVMGPGGSGYAWAKRSLVEYTEQMAMHLASRFIRVNAIHPTNCNTDLIHNDGLYGIFRPDIAAPTREDVMPAFEYFQAMPIPYIEPDDVARLAIFLASEDSRYITGQQIRIDAGSLLKWPNGPAG